MKAWKLSPRELEQFEAESTEILEDMRAGRLAAVAPSPRRGAMWYLKLLDSDLPPGVQFPLGMNHWLRESVFPDDHRLFPHKMLLADLYAIFEAAGWPEAIPGATIVKRLIAMESRPWREWKHGKRINVRNLAILLRPFDVHPRNHRAAGKQSRAYFLDSLRPVFGANLPDDGSTSTWLDVHYTWKAVRGARLVEQPPARRHKPMPLCLVRCIHAAYERVTPERIAEWCLALSPLKEPDVIAFILAEAPSDRKIHLAGNLIATRRAGFPALIDAQPGNPGQPKASTRDAYILAALSVLKRRFGGAIRYNREEGRKRKASPRRGMARLTPKSDWCAVVAPEFVSNRRPMKAQRLRELWDKLPKHERERVKQFHAPSVRFISE